MPLTPDSVSWGPVVIVGTCLTCVLTWYLYGTPPTPVQYKDPLTHRTEKLLRPYPRIDKMGNWRGDRPSHDPREQPVEEHDERR